MSKEKTQDPAKSMGAYSTVETAESLPVAQSLPVEMVEVVAPGTLSAGYTFQASYNDVVFPVTVVRKEKLMAFCIWREIENLHLMCCTFRSLYSHQEAFRKVKKL